MGLDISVYKVITVEECNLIKNNDVTKIYTKEFNLYENFKDYYQLNIGYDNKGVKIEDYYVHFEEVVDISCIGNLLGLENLTPTFYKDMDSIVRIYKDNFINTHHMSSNFSQVVAAYSMYKPEELFVEYWW